MMADDAESSSPGRRACQNCARAKAKCVPQSSGNTSDNRCARCYRMDKECAVLPRATRKRRAPNSNTGTTKLEQKIESLVALLANAQGVHLNVDQLTPPESHLQSEPSPVTPQAPDTSTQASVPWTPGFSDPRPLEICRSLRQIGLPVSGISGTGSLAESSTAASHDKQHFSSEIWQLSDQESGQLVYKFREHFMPHFPFISLQPNMPLAEVKVRRPYLLKAIWTVAFQDSRARQIAMCKELMIDISTSMLVQGEKDLDMLQSLIILNAWSYFVSPMAPATKSSALYHLATALVHDLRLTRPTREYDGPPGPGEMPPDFHTRNVPDSMMNDTSKRSSDECRALLCCYYLGSIYSTCMRNQDNLLFSSYIDYSCQTLEQRSEKESDILLVSLVRLECILAPIDNLLTRKLFSENHSAPVTMYVKSVRTQLEHFWDSLPPSIQQNQLMAISYHSNYVLVHEPSHYKAFSPSNSCTYDPSQRLDLLHNCVLACKRLLDEYTHRPLSTCYGTSVADLAPLGRGITSLVKLCHIEEPGWDLTIVRQTANLHYYFEQLLSKFQDIGADLDRRQKEPCRGSFFTGCARAMYAAKTWYETTVRPVESTHNTMQDQTTLMGFDPSVLGDQPNFLDDTYWMEIMGDWTMQQ